MSIESVLLGVSAVGGVYGGIMAIRAVTIFVVKDIKKNVNGVGKSGGNSHGKS